MHPINIFLVAVVLGVGAGFLDYITPGGIANVPHYLSALRG